MNEAAQHAQNFSNLDGAAILAGFFLLGVIIFRFQNWNYLRKNACRPCRRRKHGECTGMHPRDEYSDGSPMVCLCSNGDCHDRALKETIRRIRRLKGD